MAEEMRFHLAMRAEEQAASGVSAVDAPDAALRKFGNVARIQEEARAQRAGATWEQLGRDFTLAFRSLRKSAGFTLTGVLTLALGIGASTAVFSVVHALLVAPLPYRQADRLVEVISEHKEEGMSGLAPGTFGDLAAGDTSLSAVTAQYYYYLNLTGVEPSARLVSADVTIDFFKVFAEAPWRGRLLQPDDFKPSAAPVAVLSYGLWSGQFNSRDEIIGQQILLDDISYTVVGVMPASFKDPGETAQFWRPMRAGVDDLQNRSSRYWTAYGRLQDGATLEQANAKLATLGQRLAHDHPRNYEGWTLRASDLRALVIGNFRSGLLVMAGAIGCVILITCANLTGLATVRALSRRKELAIRTALGSSRLRLVRLLVAESLVLALLGGLGGVILAAWGMQALRASLLEAWLPRADEIALNLPVLFTAVTAAVVTGIVAGMVPGLTAGRVDAGDALKDSSRGSAGPKARRLRATLIVTEIALALVLLASTGLLGRSFLGLVHRKSGMEAERVLSLTISLSGPRYNSSPKSWSYYSRAETAVAALPGVEAAGFTQTSPFRWGIPAGFAPIRGDRPAAAEDFPQAFFDSVSIDYFRAIGCSLKAGRLFNSYDDADARHVVIISETAARRYFGNENPIGRLLTLGLPSTFEVVGVVGDVRRSGLTADAPLQVYRPLAQRPPAFATLMVRTSVPPLTLGRAVQAALNRVDPDTPVSDIATMDSVVSKSVTQPRLHFLVFGLFAGLALLLASIGLYGLVAYSVAQRTREFGIRTALGAAPRSILSLVLGEGLGLIALGVAFGLAGSLASARLLEGLIFTTSVHDPWVYVGAPLILSVIALLACLLPARRATRVDPIIALRSE